MHPDINKDLAFATMASELTPVFGALALAAVFSAEASAADAVLFMLATSGSRDLYRRAASDATDRDLLRAARWAAIAGAALGLGLAMMHRSVIDALGDLLRRDGRHVVRPARRRALRAPHVAPPGPGVARRRAGPGAVHFSTAGAGYGALTPCVSGVLVSAAAFAIARPNNA